MEKRDVRSLPEEALYELRILVINYLNKGNTIAATMDAFGVSQPYVQKVKKLYKEGGMEALKLKERGRKPDPKLRKKDQQTVSRLIRDKMPDQLKLPFALWTRQSVAELIYQRFGVKLSRWTVGRYLRSMGFTPQKPAKQAYERDPEKVGEWLDNEYPRIKQEAKEENALILWGDEMGIRSDDQVGRTYAPKGKTPVVKKAGQRFSMNMISAISNRGDLRFMIIEGKFNSDVFIEFMRRLLKGSTQKIFLIVDNHSAHKSKVVKSWVRNHEERIKLFYLPPYSPDLNPDEYLNQDIKTNTVRSNPPRNKDDMHRSVNNFLQKKKRSKERVKQYFKNENINYAA